MILFLDTSGFEKLHFALLNEITGKVSEKKQHITHSQTEGALEYLDNFLRLYKISIKQIKKIYIVSGPGSFTGIRAGVAHALAFSMALHIPVYHLSKDQVPTKLSNLFKMRLKKLPAEFNPEYGREPNITN